MSEYHCTRSNTVVQPSTPRRSVTTTQRRPRRYPGISPHLAQKNPKSADVTCFTSFRFISPTCVPWHASCSSLLSAAPRRKDVSRRPIDRGGIPKVLRWECKIRRKLSCAWDVRFGNVSADFCHQSIHSSHRRQSQGALQPRQKRLVLLICLSGLKTLQIRALFFQYNSQEHHDL